MAQRATVPSFKLMYPGAKMVVIFHNTPYRQAPVPETVKYKHLKKEDLCLLLLKRGIVEITVKKKGEEIKYKIQEVIDVGQRVKRHKCTVEGLKKTIENLLSARERMDGMKALFVDEGWEIIKTVP